MDDLGRKREFSVPPLAKCNILHWQYISVDFNRTGE
jgi:hypothetical protein